MFTCQDRALSSLQTKGCGSPLFAVCLDPEHNCEERQQWYYQNRMWWYVFNCEQAVECQQRAFMKYLNKLQRDSDMEKEHKKLLGDTDSD